MALFGRNDNKLKLAFQGSRSLKKKKEEILKIIESEIKKHDPELIITSGEPDGVCRITQYYCRLNGITLKLYHLNFKKYAGGAFYNRSKAIIEDADYIIFIHDGKSRGTQNELSLARKFGKLYIYYIIDEKEYKQDSTPKTEESWEWIDNGFKETDLEI